LKKPKGSSTTPSDGKPFLAYPSGEARREESSGERSKKRGGVALNGTGKNQEDRRRLKSTEILLEQLR
jgi:hypothetical protein